MECLDFNGSYLHIIQQSGSNIDVDNGVLKKLEIAVYIEGVDEAKVVGGTWLLYVYYQLYGQTLIMGT